MFEIFESFAMYNPIFSSFIRHRVSLAQGGATRPLTHVREGARSTRRLPHLPGAGGRADLAGE